MAGNRQAAGPWWKSPTAAYTAPFAVFVLLLVVGPKLPIGVWEQPLRVVILAAVIWFFSRDVLDFSVVAPLGSALLGVAVFLVWVAPDTLIPGYRDHWLFQNAITGQVSSSLPEGFRMNPMVLVSRTLRAVLIVPIVEELFWRGWLMRWLIGDNFTKVNLGAYAPLSFWVTAALFASEHGPYWDVGLLAGIAFNWWIIRTGKLGDCILAHAVANALLSGYVITAGRWEYWL